MPPCSSFFETSVACLHVVKLYDDYIIMACFGAYHIKSWVMGVQS